MTTDTTTEQGTVRAIVAHCHEVEGDIIGPAGIDTAQLLVDQLTRLVTDQLTDPDDVTLTIDITICTMGHGGFARAVRDSVSGWVPVTTAEQVGYGVCGHCGKRRPLQDDGLLAIHYRRHRVAGRDRRERCEGSRQDPRAQQAIAETKRAGEQIKAVKAAWHKHFGGAR